MQRENGAEIISAHCAQCTGCRRHKGLLHHLTLTENRIFLLTMILISWLGMVLQKGRFVINRTTWANNENCYNILSIAGKKLRFCKKKIKEVEKN